MIGRKLLELKIKGIDFIKKVMLEKSEVYKNFEVQTNTKSGEKYLSVIFTPNYNLSQGLDSHTIIINDITDSKIIEEQSKRNEKLIAMGELAC